MVSLHLPYLAAASHLQDGDWMLDADPTLLTSASEHLNNLLRRFITKELAPMLLVKSNTSGPHQSNEIL
jgi:hypothetical protein